MVFPPAQAYTTPQSSKFSFHHLFAEPNKHGFICIRLEGHYAIESMGETTTLVLLS